MRRHGGARRRELLPDNLAEKDKAYVAVLLQSHSQSHFVTDGRVIRTVRCVEFENPQTLRPLLPTR
jgi:hypothetical protein